MDQVRENCEVVVKTENSYGSG